MKILILALTFVTIPVFSKEPTPTQPGPIKLNFTLVNGLALVGAEVDFVMDDGVSIKKASGNKIKVKWTEIAPADRERVKAEVEKYQKEVAAYAQINHPTAGPRPEFDAETYSCPAVEKYLADILKDPGSLEISTWWKPVARGEYWIVGCEYNAKNSYGGYVGKKVDWFYIRNNEVIKTGRMPE